MKQTFVKQNALQNLLQNFKLQLQITNSRGKQNLDNGEKLLLGVNRWWLWWCALMIILKLVLILSNHIDIFFLHNVPNLVF